VTLTARVRGLPGGDNPAWVSVRSVEWTDDWARAPVAAALPDLSPTGPGYVIDVPSGFAREVWVEVRPQGIAAGTYDGSLVLEGGGFTKEVPLHVVVRALAFPAKPRLHFGGFEYTDAIASGVTAANRMSLVSFLRNHGVDSPWATAQVLPSGSFDGAGHMTDNPPTAKLDEWLGMWPGASRYQVFLYASNSLGGIPGGTPAFSMAVKEWARFWANHLESHSIDPSTFYLSIVDEPGDTTQYQTIRTWADALRASGSGIRSWIDVDHASPTTSAPEMFASCDTICPARGAFLVDGPDFQAFIRKQRAAGKELEFYSCLGPSTMLDPYAYFRLQAWTAAKEGADAEFFWSFSDNRGFSSWNEYAILRATYDPLFLDDTTVTDSKYMEASYEGVEDYEYLAMLQDAIAAARARGADATLIAQAQNLLDGAPDQVLSPAGTLIAWSQSLDRSVADTVRSSILDMLVRLTP
jgi:hypothetical protein